MRVYIIIPAHNEEKYIHNTLASLCNQTVLPDKILVVNDNSTDNTEEIIKGYIAKNKFLNILNISSSGAHIPGSKVINAFNAGLNELDENYDIICKFDADLIFPENYIETIISYFKKDDRIGLVGGFCFIDKNGEWTLENLTNEDHVRGALKAYRKNCFKDIGGLKTSMGWDTVDELLAQYHNWQIVTDKNLKVKHLKPTGKTYNKKAKYKQGEAFYRLRYGLVITMIASLKLALLKRKPLFFLDYIKGYFQAKKANLPFLVSEKEGKFIRKLRWKKIKEKLF